MPQAEGVPHHWLIPTKEGEIMLHVVTARNRHLHQAEMADAFRLRHLVFAEEKGWVDLRSDDGLETDRFDDDYAVHMLYVDSGRVIGYQRMLPTTRPHLLTHILPELCEGPFPVGPNIWEWTRYCVQARYRERGRMLSPVANALLSGIVEWGLENDIDTIVIEMNPLWLLRLVQLHFRVTPLGLPRVVHGEDTVAVTARFDARTLERLRETRQNRMAPAAALGTRENRVESRRA